MDHRIGARIAALETEINSLKALVETEAAAGPPTSDRRGMMKLMAATAVGAVTGAALLGAQPAAAADGDPFVLGGINESESPTLFTASEGSALVLNGMAGYGVVADGGVGNALFTGTGESPLGSGANLGTLFVDGGGDWWAATDDAAEAATWRKLAGPATAGQLHLLEAPVRVYDSRPGEAPTDVQPKAPTVGNAARTIDTTFNNSGVPSTANAVLISFTITGPRGAGFATVWPSGPWPGTSNINFTPGQDIAATAIVGCGALATIQVLSNVVTDFIIDVSGYYQ